MPPSRSLVRLALLLTLVAVSCTGGDDPGPTGPTRPDGPIVNAIVSSSDHYVGAPQRVGVGLVMNDGRLISYGSVDFAFTFTGDGTASTEPVAGPTATAVYVPTPGTDDAGSTPTLTTPAEARGIYEAQDVVFDRPGSWRVDVLAEVEGQAVRASTTIGVTAEPALPAPGQPALETENLTLQDHDDASLAAVDSRAESEGVVPDKILHRMTIADALDTHMPIVAVFSTPVFCESQFCGPVTDVIEDLAERYGDRAAFIHVEVWRDHENNVINQAAADWLYRNDDLTEPWTYLIDAEGTIVDRWPVLIRSEELEAQLEALPTLAR